jgi:hypothetical protein
MELKIPKSVTDKYNLKKKNTVTVTDTAEPNKSKFVVKLKTKDLKDFANEDESLASAMAFAFGLGITDTVRGGQQIVGSEKNYLTGRNMKDEQAKLKNLMDEKGFAVTAAYFGGAILDPAGWLIPLAKARTLLKMGGYGMVSGGIAGATGYVDEDSIINSRDKQALLGLVGGGVLAPTIGGLKNLGVRVTGKGRAIPLWDKPMRPMQYNYTTKDADKFGLQKQVLPGKEVSRIKKGNKIIIKTEPRKDILVRPSKLIEKELVDPKLTDDFINPAGKTILPRIFRDEKGKIAFGRKDIELGIKEKGLVREQGQKLKLRDEQELKLNTFKAEKGNMTKGPMYFFRRYIAAPYSEKVGMPLWEKIKTGEGGLSFGGALLGYAQPLTTTTSEDTPITTKLGTAFMGALAGYVGGKYALRTKMSTIKSLGGLRDGVFQKQIGPESDKILIGDETLREFLGRGFIDMFGVPTEVKALKNNAFGFANRLQGQFEVQLRNMEKLSPSELAVVHNLIEGDITDAAVKNRALSKVAKDTKLIIQDISQKLVDYGFIRDDVMKRNFNSYLSRVYLDQDRIDIKSISDQLRPRGHVELVSYKDYLKSYQFEKAYSDGRKKIMVRGGKDEPEFVPHRGWELPPGVTLKDLKSKKGIEILKAKGLIGEDDSISIRWEMLKPERLMKGEIEDASYAINQTMRMMTGALGQAKFYNDMAVNYAIKKNDKLYRGLSEKSMNDKNLFKLPLTKLDPGNPNSPLRYGNLAGKYVPKEVFVNVVQYQKTLETKQGAFYKTYNTLNQMWKASKTAWNPTVHVNNVFGNVFFTDMADVDFKNLPLAARMLANHNNLDKAYQSKIIRMAKEHGVFDAGFVDKELRNIDKTGLTSIYKYNFNKNEWENSVGIAERTFGYVRNNKFTGTLNEFYRIEDHIFRLNAFIDRLQKGYTADEAAMFSRKHFIDYDIDAPFINSLRRSATPFLAFSYRAVPVLAETAVVRPWKYAKYGAMGYLLNKAGEKFGGGDADRERALIDGDTYKGGNLLGIPFMPYKNIKLPFQTKDGQSKYMFIERYFPGGDVLELGNGALPALPAPLQPSFGVAGSIGQALFGYDFFTKETIKGKGVSSVDDINVMFKYLSRQLIPNFPFVPGSFSTERINKATFESKSAYREDENEITAILNSVGFKINNVSVTKLKRSESMRLNKKLKVIKADIKDLVRQLKEGRITKQEYDGKRQDKIEQMKDLALNSRLRLEGFDPALVREPQFILDILAQYGIIDKEYADTRYKYLR